MINANCEEVAAVGGVTAALWRNDVGGKGEGIEKNVKPDPVGQGFLLRQRDCCGHYFRFYEAL
jgi:hypothetical protein